MSRFDSAFEVDLSLPGRIVTLHVAACALAAVALLRLGLAEAAVALPAWTLLTLAALNAAIDPDPVRLVVGPGRRLRILRRGLGWESALLVPGNFASARRITLLCGRRQVSVWRCSQPESFRRLARQLRLENTDV